MDKKKSVVIIIVIIILIYFFQIREEADTMVIKVAGWDMEYTVSNRKLTIEDFESVEMGSSLNEIEKKFGKPDGWVGGGILLPVYILEDKSAVELVFNNDISYVDLEAIYLYKGESEFVLKTK